MGLAHSPRIVTDGLVLCLDAANQKSYPGTGTAWTDLSGNGNNGALINGAEPVKQNSIVFDGSGDFLTLTNLSSTYLSNNFCIESWVYVTTQASQTLFNTIPHASFDINLNRGGSGQTALYIGNGSSWQTLDFRSSGTLVANQWHHIAVTRNSNVITIWHNGVNQGSTSAFMPTGFGTSAYIGTYNGSTGENVNGKIYGYRIVSGSPVYTANFTPPARVSSISGTQLIVAQDGGFVNGAQTSVVATPSGNTYVNDQSYMKFDGVDDYIINSSSTNIPVSNSSRTIQFWVYPKTATNTFIQLGTGGGGNQVYVISFYTNGPTYLFTDGINGGNNLTISGPQLPILNMWNHITFGNSGQNWFYYINGILRHSGTWSVALNTIGQKYIVGKRDDYVPSPGNTNGNISNVLIYNRSLSAQEVQQNFNALRGRYGL